MKVIIIDFDDSFTYNLAGLFKSWGIDSEVISYDFLELNYLLDNNVHTVVWGPGPGHPDEYKKASNIISKLITSSDIYQIGICLGHQLLMKYFGYKIVPAAKIRHGVSELFKLPKWSEFDPESFGREIAVQYYSSLGAKFCSDGPKLIEVISDDSGLIHSARGANMLSFQFHPESVGTSCPEAFFHGWRKTLI